MKPEKLRMDATNTAARPTILASTGEPGGHF